MRFFEFQQVSLLSLSPSSSPTVHPFRGYQEVGSGQGGECVASSGELYSRVDFTGVESVENCAERCEQLDTTDQVGIGYEESDSVCRCYFDGEAPKDVLGGTGQGNPGTGPVAGRAAAENEKS